MLTAPPEATAITAPKVDASMPEHSACSDSAKEAISESSMCPAMAKEASLNPLRVLLFPQMRFLLRVSSVMATELNSELSELRHGHRGRQ